MAGETYYLILTKSLGKPGRQFLGTAFVELGLLPDPGCEGGSV